MIHIKSRDVRVKKLYCTAGIQLLIFKLGEFSAILGMKISKLFRRTMAPDPLELARVYGARAKAARAFGALNGQIDILTASVNISFWLRA